MRKLLAAAASLSLAAAPVAAQPAPGTEPQQEQERSDGGSLKGERWGYYALPAIIVLILLIAVLGVGDEDPASP